MISLGDLNTGHDLVTRLRKLERADPPFAAVPRAYQRGSRWAEPRLVAAQLGHPLADLDQHFFGDSGFLGGKFRGLGGFGGCCADGNDRADDGCLLVVGKPCAPVSQLLDLRLNERLVY